MKKMKDMPGMGNIQSMLNKMGMNAGKGGSGKVNVNAMQTNLAQRLQKAKNSERLLKKMNERKAAAAFAAAQAQAQAQSQSTSQAASKIASEQIENLVFSKGENVERSTRDQQISGGIKKKKKKNNKKK